MSAGLLGTPHLRLPNELILLVIDNLAGDLKALCNLAQTCRGLQYPAEAQIYKKIELLSVTDLEDVIYAFATRYERARAVHTLRILYQYRPEELHNSEHTRAIFNECISHMVNLREWHIESPFDNCKWSEMGGQIWVENDMGRFWRALEQAATQGPKEAELISAQQRLGKYVDRTVGLALLEKLTIHSHGIGEDFWDIGAFECIFRHPKLRYVHLSCVSFPAGEMRSLATHVQKTPLTTLTFDECELDHKSLLSILRTPANLKHLTLGENVFNTMGLKGLDPRLSRNPRASLIVLSVVAHSLETLTHFDPAWRIMNFRPLLSQLQSHGEGLRKFHHLKTLECDTSSFLHRSIMKSPEFGPPNLETLRLRRHWKGEESWYETPPKVDCFLSLPSISTVELLQISHLHDQASDVDYVNNPEFLKSRQEAAYKLWKCNINLKLVVEMHNRNNLIPPYLHGESLPITTCFYNASIIGFHRHIYEKTPLEDRPEDEPEEVTIKRVEDFLEKHENPPETDQLGEIDIMRMQADISRDRKVITKQFLKQDHATLDMETYAEEVGQEEADLLLYALESSDVDDSDDEGDDVDLFMDAPDSLSDSDDEDNDDDAYEDADQGDGNGEAQEGGGQGASAPHFQSYVTIDDFLGAGGGHLHNC